MKLSVFSALALVALCGAANLGTVAHAQAPAATAQFGMVDMRRVLEQSKSRQAITDDLERTQRAYEGVLQRLGQGSARFLPESEIVEIAGLYEKPKPTDVEAKRLSALETKGDTIKREMTTLQNTQDPTPVQTARYEALSALQDAGTKAFEKLNRTLSAKLQDKVRDAEQKALTAARASIAKVAKAKNLALVFTADVVAYATLDITDDVIKDANK